MPFLTRIICLNSTICNALEKKTVCFNLLKNVPTAHAWSGAKFSVKLIT